MKETDSKEYVSSDAPRSIELNDLREEEDR